MTRRVPPWTVAVTCLIVSACNTDRAGGGAAADQPGTQPIPAEPPSESAQRQLAIVSELQAIDRALTPVREQARQAPEVQAREQELIEEVDAAMVEIDPRLAGVRDRFDSLRLAFENARRSGDSAQAVTLGGELQALGTTIQETQTQAMGLDGLAASLDSFREDLFDRMRALDPKVDSLLNRADELNQELETLGQG